MTSIVPPPAKKQKKEENLESSDYDNETQKALEEIDACQNNIDQVNEKASEDILKIEQKFNKLRRPFFEKRCGLIRTIPNFWITAFMNHPQISNMIDEEEEDCLHYIVNLEVTEFEDIKFGYKIKFVFDTNPYLENDVLTKEFNMEGPKPCTKSTPIKWKEGQDLLKALRERDSQKQGKKQSSETRSFFTWYETNVDPGTDEIADVIKDDLWSNPLQYYVAPDFAADTNGVDEEEGEDEGDSEDDDDSVIILDDEENDDDEEDDDDDPEVIENSQAEIEGDDGSTAAEPSEGAAE